jgi:hypothetical protein
MKTCTKCKIDKELEKFRKEKRRLSGYGPICKECSNKINNIAYHKNPEKAKASTMRWMRANPESNKAAVRKYRAKNPEQCKERTRKWRKDNPELQRKFVREYKARNPEKERAWARAWRRRVRQATPKWLSKEQRQQIVEIYKNCPKGYQVDHIIPIRGKNISGLHVPWNLQYLTSIENARKGNRGF